MKTVTISGHRPEKINDPAWIRAQIRWVLEGTLLANHLIQGMAPGVDIWSAEIARQIGLLYTCARPWAGHKPRKDNVKGYEDAIYFADKVVVVNPAVNYPGAWVYQKRNEWMVDHGDVLLAVWDGSSGGTSNCVEYAEKKSRPIYRIDEKQKKWGWYANGPVQV